MPLGLKYRQLWTGVRTYGSKTSQGRDSWRASNSATFRACHSRSQWGASPYTISCGGSACLVISTARCCCSANVGTFHCARSASVVRGSTSHSTHCAPVGRYTGRKLVPAAAPPLRHVARQTLPVCHSPILPWLLGTVGRHTARKRSSRLAEGATRPSPIGCMTATTSPSSVGTSRMSRWI
jgi:hypothetical protein